MRYKVVTPRGIRSIDVGSGGRGGSHSMRVNLSGGSILVHHEQGSPVVAAYYLDDAKWIQSLKVNNEVSDPLNYSYIYSLSNLGERDVILTFE